MKKILRLTGATIALSLVLSSVPCFTVLASSLENFKYENDFSTADAPGSGSTGAWDMNGVGQWVTVKKSETDDMDQWSYDTTAIGPSGEADGVLKLGDGARSGLYFNTPITSGNVHVGFDFYYGTEGDTRSTWMYSMYGFMKSYSGDLSSVSNDEILVSGSSDFDNELVKAFRTVKGGATANPQYTLAGLGDTSYAGATNLSYNQWMRVDIVLENIDNLSNNMSAKWFVNGTLEYTYTTPKVLQPLNGFVLQTNTNFNNEYILIDNLVIEHSSESKVLKLSCESDSVEYGATSVGFNLTDDVETGLLIPENIVVKKDYGARTLIPGVDYRVGNVTSNSFNLVFDGGTENGIYTVALTDSVVNSWGLPSDGGVKFTVGKLENFVYRQDFSENDGPSGPNAWDDSSIGQWVTAVTSSTNDYDQWERKDTLGPDGRPGVLSLGDAARPTFWFNMPVADGKIHLTYYAKFKEQTTAHPYYYSGFAGTQYTGDITISDDKVTVSSHTDDKLVDTFMASGMHSTPSIAVGTFDSNQPGSNKITGDFTKWYRFDVLMDIKSDGKVSAKYYIDGVEKWTVASTTTQAPFYGMVFQTNVNFDDGEVLIDDVLIRHYSKDKEGAMAVIRKDSSDAFIDINQESVTFEFPEVVSKQTLSGGIVVQNKTTNQSVPFTVETIDEAAPAENLSRGFKINFQNEEPFSKGTKFEIGFSSNVKGAFTGSVPDKYVLRTDWEKVGDIVVPAVQSIVFIDAKGREVTSAPYSSTLTKAVVTFNTTVTDESAKQLIYLQGGSSFRVNDVENIELDGEQVSRVTVDFTDLLNGNTEYVFVVDTGIESTEDNSVCSGFAETVSFKTQSDAGTAFSQELNVSGSNLSYSASLVKNKNVEQNLTIMICGYKTITVNNEEGVPTEYSYLLDSKQYPITLEKDERGVFPVEINVSDWNTEATYVKTFLVRWPDLSMVEIDSNGFIN